MNSPSLVRPAQDHELETALALIFQASPGDEHAARVANAMRLIRLGELDPAGVFVRANAEKLLGALVCCAVPGASGLIWPPQALAGSDREAIEDQLLQQGLVWLRQRGAKLVQSLLTDNEAAQASSLLRNGFRHITSLWYMRCLLKDAPDGRIPGACCNLDLRLMQTTDCDVATFGATLLRTYDGTLDCPEVNGVRTIDEILEGHRAQGRGDSHRWWLAYHGEKSIGVLLLAEMEEWPGWDISYVGVTPDARRRGFGTMLVQRALDFAVRAGVEQLTLSVDARNTIARHLYERLGFRRFDGREVFLAILPS